MNADNPSAPPQDDVFPPAEESFVYAIEGAPWWMPINIDVSYEPGANPDGADNAIQHGEWEDFNTEHDADLPHPIPGNADPFASVGGSDPFAMDAVSVQTIRAPYFESLADVRFPEGDGVEQANQRDEARRKFLLSIDYQINCRKFILFTSLLFFIVAMTFGVSVWREFYELKGWGFNSMVLLLLLYGLAVGAICSNMMRYSAQCLLRMLNVYWICCWLTIIGLFVTAIVYLVLFPTKFQNFCHSSESCTVNTTTLIFAECSLVSFLMVYIVLMLFYMQRVAHLVLLITNLRVKSNYRGQHESSWVMRMCHQHIYRYIIGWKTFRRLISNRTGLRMTDVLYCSCCFRRCRRQSATPWKPLNYEELVTEEISNQENDSNVELMVNASSEETGGSDVSDQKEEAGGSDDHSKEKDQKKKGFKEKKRRSSYNSYNYYGGDYYGGYYGGYGGGYGHGGSDVNCCRDCSACCGSVCRSICECPLYCLRGCCSSPSVYHHHHHPGQCHLCCDACAGIMGCDGDCDCNCGSCDCDCDCGEGICGTIMLGILTVVLFLLPLVVYACIVAPFWVFALWLSSKLSDKVQWWLVVILFILFLIPPSVIWFYLFTAICEGNMLGMDSDTLSVMCMTWEFVMLFFS